MKAITINKNIREVKRLAKAIVDQREAERWMHRPNDRLDGRTPLEQIKAGKAQRVVNFLMVILWGGS